MKWQRAKRRRHPLDQARGEVRGTNAKPCEAKGHRARARATERPRLGWWWNGLWPSPSKLRLQHAEKGAEEGAPRGAVASREDKLVVLDEFPVDGGKTKSVTAALAKLGAAQPLNKVLIVDAQDNELLVRGTRNLRAPSGFPEGLNVYDVLNHQTW